MGTDIHGWVEVKECNKWVGLFRIDYVVCRNYDMFGCLFGVRNYANFKPVAPNRGLPDDVSWLVKFDYEEDEDAHSPTWISYKEIKEINWDEEAEDYDSRVHEYVEENGKLRFVCKFIPCTTFTPEEMRILMQEKELRKGNRIYKIEKIKRKDALSDSWKLLFELMGVLAKYYGEKNVRLVVWFDN